MNKVRLMIGMVLLLGFSSSSLAIVPPWWPSPIVARSQVQPDAQALIDKALVAHGGRAAIEGIKTMTRLEVGRVLKTDGSLDYTEGWREILDFVGQRYRNENISAGVPYGIGQGTTALNTEWAWDTGVQPPSEPYLENLRSDYLKMLVGPIRSALLLGARTVHGVSGQAVSITIPKNDGAFTYLIGDDGTILARAFDTDFLPGGSAMLFDDYRDVGDIRTYFHFRSFRGEVLRLDYRAKDVQVNPTLTDSMFVFPPPPVSSGRIGLAYEATPGQGLKVTEVVKNAAADQAGIKTGDLIVEVNGLSVINVDDTMFIGIRGEPGTVVNLTVRRGGQVLKFSIIRVK